MAIFRTLQISFWQDEFVLELTPEEKFFYLYLMTNSKSTQCGKKRLVELETGYKKKAFLQKFYEVCKVNNYPIELIFVGVDIPEEELAEKQGLPRGEEGAYKGLGEKEIKKETATTKNKDTAVAFEEVIEFFNNNIHLITPHEQEVLIDWSQSFENEVLLMAVKEAVEHNVRKIKYINGILNNWFSLGLITADRVQQYKVESKASEGGKQVSANASAYEYID